MMAKLKLFRFAELPAEIQLRVLHYLLGDATATHLLLLSKAHYGTFATYLQHNAVFTFDSAEQLGRFLNVAKDSTLHNVRHVRHNYGFEARPSLNSNSRKDAKWNAKWNAMKVKAFIDDLTQCHEACNMRRLEVCFETELLLHKFSFQDYASTIEQILTYDTTTIRTARMSEDILLKTFVGWDLQREFEYCAWWHAEAKGHDFDNYVCPHNAMDCKGHRGEDDDFDEAVVHQVTLILTKT